MNTSSLVQKVWNFCHTLRDDGVGYGDYLEQLTYLLFLKLAHEYAQPPYERDTRIPAGHDWASLRAMTGEPLERQYLATLHRLGGEPGMLGAIFFKAQNKIQDPAKLSRLVQMIDAEDWISLDADTKGDLYEGLLQKNANETKSGAGQYFTPRPLIKTIIHLLKPQPREVVQDPAAGTAGFLIEADRYVKSQTNDLDDLDGDTQDFQIHRAFIGLELVPGTRRLALMNCLLHDIEGNLDHGGAIRLGNTLGSDGENLPKAHIVATNPPFGSAAGTNITRTFVHPTSNKQLCFMQHIIETLHPGGRAAVVVPDNVLFEGGKGTDIRRDLMDKCHLHTILRLPSGIFYAQGVKTNVLFFTKGTVANPNQDKNCTDDVWVYDLRTNMPSFGKRTPFTDEHLQPFERVYGEDPHGLSPRTEGEWSFNAEETEVADSEENKNTDQHLATSRWRKFSREWIRSAKSDSLDISWLKDKDSIDADNLPEPDVLAAEAMGELVQALGELDALMRELGASDEADAQRQLLEEAFGGVKE